MIPWNMGVWQPFSKMATNKPSFNGSNLCVYNIVVNSQVRSNFGSTQQLYKGLSLSLSILVGGLVCG